MRLIRRDFLGSALASGVGLSLGTGLAGCVPLDQSSNGRLAAKLGIIEAATSGQLGVELLDIASGQSIGINQNTRFGHCSSFKLSLAAMVLQRHANGSIDASRRLRWSETDLMFHSPFTAEHVEQGASLMELAEAVQRYSDNAAANLLLHEMGGPPAVTAFWRSLGDNVSRLDRAEPQVNNVPEGELRDTTTPAAMARTVAKITYGEVLAPTQRDQLRQWMRETETGKRRVRAGLPKNLAHNWDSGDKTGTSGRLDAGRLYIDIGFVEAPRGTPFSFAAYFRAQEEEGGINPASEALLAQVGDVLADFASR